MPEQTFSASYDSTTKTISAVVCLLLMVVAWMVHIVYVAVLFPLLIGLAYAYSPRAYALSRDGLSIKRLIGNIRVPLADIREVRAGSPDDFTGCVRLGGSGGLFGYYGLFRTAKLGKCNWYMTNRSNSVIVVTAHKTLVLSPDDVQGFLAAAAPHSGGISSAAAPLVPGYTAGSPAGKFVAIGIGMLGLALAVLALVYSPGPPEYTLISDELTIHDRFYPVTLRAGSIDGNGIRIVDLAQSEWRPTLRTNGFANRSYQSGWFRVANGKTVRLYRAGGNRLVLIPPKGDGVFVLYQAKDPEELVRKLRQWAGTTN